MDPVDIDKLVEKAKADASKAGVSDAPGAAEGKIDSMVDEVTKTSERSSLFHVSDDQVEQLSRKVQDLAEQDIVDMEVAKQAALERGRNVKIAKLLAAVDVFSGVGR